MTPEQIVRKFFEEERSGHNPDYSNKLMAEQVSVHQIVSDEEQTVLRKPKDYAEHDRSVW
jgi:hypothetical protein